MSAITDPIADMLTRIRNGLGARHPRVEMPSSKLRVELARILKEEGYIANYRLFEDGKAGQLKILLRYDNAKEPAIGRLIRVSKSSHRVYRGWQDLIKKSDSYATSIVSTSRGVMTARKAKSLKMGGEVLLKVW